MNNGAHDWLCHKPFHRSEFERLVVSHFDCLLWAGEEEIDQAKENEGEQRHFEHGFSHFDMALFQ